ncbi:MAG TPA: alpha/beta fold hydrolase [Bryobacteraceae bacterium]|jgi:dienelactone hydrolase|nr:alpha/beta fold hydrolase [Bryobacteraceae bacterium]
MLNTTIAKGRSLTVAVLFPLALAGTLRKKMEHAFFVPDPLPIIDAKQFGSFEVEPGIVADRVTYATEYGLRVPAIAYHPSDESVERPTLIVVNGHGGDKYSWYSVYAGVLFARAGAVVLTYDAIGEGERNSQHKSGTRQHDRYVPPDENGPRLAGLMMTDLRGAVSYLRTRKDVDSARIAAAGYSMGSFVVSIGCAVETRLHACVVAGGGDLDGPGGYWDTSNKKMCQALPYQALRFLGDRPATIFALNAERGPLLIWNGSADDMVAIPTHGEEFFRAMRQRTIQLLGSDKNVFEYGFTPGSGHRPYFLTRPVAAWLDRQLHFPNWDAIARDATKISEWAKANNVPMDKLYATEFREGGTVALGKNVPFIQRDKLNVLPESEWEKQKSHFTLESWYQHVRAASTSGPAGQSSAARLQSHR